MREFCSTLGLEFLITPVMPNQVLTNILFQAIKNGSSASNKIIPGKFLRRHDF